jgi:hypothetical protein
VADSLGVSFERIGGCEGRFFRISGTCYQGVDERNEYYHTCIVSRDRSCLFPFRRDVVLITSLYPIAVLQPDSFPAP